MTKRHDKGTSSRRGHRVAEPVQVYLEAPDRERLNRLTSELDATKSDVLRRGLAALESLTRRDSGSRVPGDSPSLPLPTFRGEGLQPGVDLDDTASLIDLMNAGDAPG